MGIQSVSPSESDPFECGAGGEAGHELRRPLTSGDVASGESGVAADADPTSDFTERLLMLYLPLPDVLDSSVETL
jgi:hypothetical protein